MQGHRPAQSDRGGEIGSLALITPIDEAILEGSGAEIARRRSERES
jgi:hypothetical protein